jgi:hypothetical protein
MLAVAGLLAFGSANAAFITSGGTMTTRTVPTTNDFATQLAAAGLTTFMTSTSLALDAAGTVTASYLGKEASFTNQFLWSGTPIFTTGGAGTDAWNTSGTTVTRSAGAGVLDFAFCSVSPTRCLTNAQNASVPMNSAENIGYFIPGDGSVAWLLFDDSSGTSDDNDYDDMIVRLQVASAPRVPEPATLGLLGAGLLAAGAAARRRRRS